MDRTGSGRADIITLLANARGGDDGALEELARRTLGPVRRHLQRTLGTELGDRADDATMETLVRVLQHLHGCRAESAPAYWRWVLTIARNEALRLLRSTYMSNADVQATALIEVIWAQRTPRISAGSASDLLLPLIREETAQLNPELQRLLFHRMVEGLSWEEVGAKIGISEAAAKRRFQRLQKRLRKRILSEVERYHGRDRPILVRSLWWLRQRMD